MYENHNIDEYKIISFDVFDTVVTRTTVDPAGIFLKMQLQLSCFEITQQLKNSFPVARKSAERAARKNKKREDIRFSDIYAHLGKQYELGEEVLQKLMELEIETEVESIRVIHSNFLLIKELRERGKRIVFVSDMYLPLAVIRRILEKVEVLSEDDAIYVSSEHGLTKSSGNLYLEVLSCENCHPDHLLHIGDNFRSDYLVAKMIGKINACHYGEGHFTRFEKILRQADTKENDLYWQLLAGTSRIARLHSHIYDDEQKKALFEIGANVVGPALWGFVSWVLERSRERAINRLYFIARDGEILFRIAQQICAARDSGPELVYLYGSRQAWHIASISRVTEQEVHWITVKDPFLTLRQVAFRLCLEPQEVVSCFKSHLIRTNDLDGDLSRQQRQILIQELHENEALHEKICAVVARKRTDLIGYLEQERLFDGQSWALVDSGWNGRLQNSLTKVLNQAGYNDGVFGFYFGLLSDIEPPLSKEAYFFSSTAPLAYRKLGEACLNLLELLMSADHGMTLGYELDNNNVWRPVLADTPSDFFHNCGLVELREGVRLFIDNLDDSMPEISDYYYKRKMLALMRSFYFYPPLESATALGQIPFSTDQSEHFPLHFAPPLSFVNSLRYCLTVRRRDQFRFTFWSHGSRVQSTRVTNFVTYSGSIVRHSISAVYDLLRSLCRLRQRHNHSL